MADYVRKADQFFVEVSKRCNYIDPKLVKVVYIALIRTILHFLRVDGSIKLPSWGEFRLTKLSPRRQHNVNRGEFVTFPACNSVRFAPGHLLREYLKKL
jgi:nucleoid DNA-binding protein